MECSSCRLVVVLFFCITGALLLVGSFSRSPNLQVIHHLKYGIIYVKLLFNILNMECGFLVFNPIQESPQQIFTTSLTITVRMCLALQVFQLCSILLDTFFCGLVTLAESSRKGAGSLNFAESHIQLSGQLPIAQAHILG